MQNTSAVSKKLPPEFFEVSALSVTTSNLDIPSYISKNETKVIIPTERYTPFVEISTKKRGVWDFSNSSVVGYFTSSTIIWHVVDYIERVKSYYPFTSIVGTEQNEDGNLEYIRCNNYSDYRLEIFISRKGSLAENSKYPAFLSLYKTDSGGTMRYFKISIEPATISSGVYGKRIKVEYLSTAGYKTIYNTTTASEYKPFSDQLVKITLDFENLSVTDSITEKTAYFPDLDLDFYSGSWYLTLFSNNSMGGSISADTTNVSMNIHQIDVYRKGVLTGVWKPILVWNNGAFDLNTPSSVGMLNLITLRKVSAGNTTRSYYNYPKLT